MKRNKRMEYIRNARKDHMTFMAWLLERPRAFVVFNKSDLKALRAPTKE